MTRKTCHQDLSTAAREAAKHIRRGKGADTNVVVGPIVWELYGDMRRWYFVAASADQKGFHTHQLAAQDESLCEQLRAAFVLALVEKRPIVIHDMADELQMARMCETIWPSAKTSKIRAGIEAERAGTSTH